MPELRKDPVTGRWVIISTERAKRPTDFIRERVVAHDGVNCPFCPGNEHRTPPELLSYRENGVWSLRVVPNKFPALRVEGDIERQGEGMYDRMNGIGAHEVIIESPQHVLSLAELPEKTIEDLFWAYRDRVLDLRKDFRLRYVLLFKNHGEAAGATLEHTHSQIIALPVLPSRVREEFDGALRHFQHKERCIFCDIVRQESEAGTRVIVETPLVQAIEPYAPRFPFETWVLPRAHISHFESSDPKLIQDLAWTVRLVLRKLERALEQPAYNLMIHSAPVQDGAMAHYHWHIEIIPRLTKTAGFEWGTGFYINPTPPEEAAEFLRRLSV